MRERCTHIVHKALAVVRPQFRLDFSDGIHGLPHWSRAVRLLAETKGEAWVNKGSVWHMVQRLDATFDPKDHGHANFAEMVKAMDAVVEIKRGETDHMLRVR